MRLLLLAVGRLRPALREVCDDYLRRFGRVVTIEEHEVREAGRTPAGGARRDEEARRILKLLPAGVPVTLLDPTGSLWTSEQVAERLDDWRLSARDRALVIGGADGIGRAVRERADETWSLGRLTLPHELARVVVIEQLYRAGTILRGEPYHRGAT
jgi:23S rRNA (pseudouridine1915-N3)-methyltransferase